MARRTAPSLVVVLTALLLGTAAPPGAGAATAPCAGATRPVQALPATTGRRAVACLVNRERRRRGLRPYRSAGGLRRAAQAHAADMVRRRFFDHVAPGGSTPASRVRRTGWLDGARAWSIGEAIGWAGGRRTSAAAIVRLWLRSPPHRAILLDRGFRWVGVGIAGGTPRGGDGATFVLDAGRR